MLSQTKRQLLPVSVFSLIAIVAGLATNPAMVAGAPPPVLHIDHEENLYQYTRLIPGSGLLARSTAAALDGTASGLAVQLGGADPIYGEADFAPLTSPQYRFRFCLDPNGLVVGASNIHNIAALYGPRTSPRAWVTLRYRDGSYQVQVEVRNDAYGTHSSAWYAVTDAEHSIEVSVEYASSSSASDGRASIWIDGAPQETINGIDLYDLAKPQRLRMGSVWPLQDRTAGTYYLDEFVLRNDNLEIGLPDTPADARSASVDLDHEANLAEYDRVVLDGDDLQQSSAAALGGTSGGMQVTIDDATAVYGVKSFDTPSGSAYRFRHYVDPNGLSMPDRTQVSLAILRHDRNVLTTRLRYTAQGYQLYVRYADDNNTWRSMAPVAISDAEHYVEVLVEFASGPQAHNGRIAYWVDDVQADQDTDLALYAQQHRPTKVHIGAPWVSDAAIRGTLYVDEFVLYDSSPYIGPVSAPSVPTATATPTDVPTSTPTPALTSTPTDVPTSTPTDMPTSTPTDVPTSTPTDMPTSTPTPALTATPVVDAIIVDDSFAGFSSGQSQDAWTEYTNALGQHYGGGHHFHRQAGDGQDVATWSFTVPQPGQYQVFAWWWAATYRPADVPYTVHHAAGTSTIRVNQQHDGGQWNALGSFVFQDRGAVSVSDDVTSGRDIVADAVRLVYVGPPTAPIPTNTATPTATVAPTTVPTATATPAPTNTPQPGRATIIDHRRVDASRLSATERQRAANAITYFNHMSVGRNILDHVDYWGSIGVRSGTGTGPGINHTEEGNNASHLSKLRAFESNVRAGHEIAFQKFCFVDFPIRDSGQTVFDNYRAYMERLQARYPNTVFVWWTAPVRTTDDNPRRAEFNRLVRQYVSAHGGILFDIADIESDGGRCGTDVMCPEYTSDGGHLNTTGGRRVAGAFWVMLVEAANASAR